MKKTLLALSVLGLFSQAYAGGLDISPASNAQVPVADKPMISAQPVTTAAKAQATAPAKATPTPAKSAPVAQVKMPSSTANLPLQVAKPAAQPVSGASSTVKASATAETNAAVPAAAGSGAVNPFTGSNLGAEAIQRQLERAKSETQLLEERLKQATLMADMESLPAKKKAELAQLKLNEVPSMGVPGAVGTPAKAVKVAKARVVKRKAPAAASPAVEMAHTAAAPAVELEGVVVNNGYASAVLSVNGNTSIIPNGAATPFGQLQVLSDSSARVGGMTLQVHDSTIARVKISDPKPVDPKAAAAPGMPSVTPLPNFSNSKAPTLPPVPLPPTK